MSIPNSIEKLMPKNLQVIKLQNKNLSSVSNCSIKEKLNQHVKRRLNGLPENQYKELLTTATNPNIYAMAMKFSENDQQNELFKTTQKPRKQYQKRVNKLAGNVVQPSPIISFDNNIKKTLVTTRKYKRRKTLSDNFEKLTQRNVLGVDNIEDESQDMEIRSRTIDKVKIPDVLGMLLNIKKRSLLQNPEVIQLLSQYAQ